MTAPNAPLKSSANDSGTPAVQPAAAPAGGESREVYGTPLLQTYPPVFKNRNFLFLWVAYIVSALGDRIQMLVALHLLCGETMLNTRNPATGQVVYGTQQSAQLTIAMLLPFAILGPFSGLLADRLPRRAVMITADVVRALVIIAVRTVFIEFRAGMPLQTLMVLLFGSELLMATFAAFFSPAQARCCPTWCIRRSFCGRTRWCRGRGRLRRCWVSWRAGR